MASASHKIFSLFYLGNNHVYARNRSARGMSAATLLRHGIIVLCDSWGCFPFSYISSLNILPGEGAVHTVALNGMLNQRYKYKSLHIFFWLDGARYHRIETSVHIYICSSIHPSHALPRSRGKGRTSNISTKASSHCGVPEHNQDLHALDSHAEAAAGQKKYVQRGQGQRQDE